MANWKATHAEKNQREGDTCHNNWKWHTLWNNSKRHLLWKWNGEWYPPWNPVWKRPTLKKVTRRKYRSRANGFQNIRKDSDRSLGHAQRRLSRNGTKNASIYGLSGRPFPIALSTFWALSWVWSTILHFEHPLALFRTLGNIWAIFQVSRKFRVTYVF